MARPLAHNDGDHVSAAPDCISPPHKQALLTGESREHVVGIPDGLAKLREMDGQQLRMPLGDVTGAHIRQLDFASEDRTAEANHGQVWHGALPVRRGGWPGGWRLYARIVRLGGGERLAGGITGGDGTGITRITRMGGGWGTGTTDFADYAEATRDRRLGGY